MSLSIQILAPKSPSDAPDGIVASVFPFEGAERLTSDPESTETVDLPRPLLFNAYLEILDREAADLPRNNRSFTLLSHRLLQVARAATPIHCQEMPAVLIDDTLEHGDKLYSQGRLDEVQFREHYSVLLDLPTVDLIDWERSEYERSSFAGDRVAEFDHLVLRHQENLPGVFRVKELSHYLFCSAPCGSALMDAGLLGLRLAAPDTIFPVVAERAQDG